MKVLITGFMPFGGSDINPAYEAVKLLPNVIENAQIIKLEIPVVFKKEAEVLELAIKEHNPDITICVGQAGKRSSFCIEKVAINLMEARIPDNDGYQPSDLPIHEDGETAYFTNLPIKAMVNNVKKAGIPAKISYTAGTYVCNDIMYRLLYMIEKKYPNMKGGFIHVPYLPEQAVNLADLVPYMSREMIAKALEIAIATAVKGDEISMIMGETE